MHTIIGFLHKIFCLFVIRKIRLCELFAITFKFLDKLWQGVHFQSLGLGDLQLEVDKHIEIFIHIFLVDDVALDIVFLIDIHKLLSGNGLVAHFYESL